MSESSSFPASLNTPSVPSAGCVVQGGSTARQASAAARGAGVTALGVAGRAALDTPTKFADRGPVEDQALGRLERWELQSWARRLLPGERVAVCMRCLQLGRSAVDVWHVAPQQAGARGSAHYGGLMVCGSVWICPVCAAKISSRRREELAAAIAAHRASGGTVALATYTFRHGLQMPLERSLASFTAAQRYLTETRSYRALRASCGLVGTISALEVTVGPVYGWHPHRHSLLFLAGAPDLPSLAAQLFTAWASAAGRAGLSVSPAAFDLRAAGNEVDEYIAKYGHEPARRPWAAEDELVRANSKRGRGDNCSPFDLLRWVRDTGEVQPVEWFREYAAAFHGRHQLQWSRGLRDRFGLAPAVEDCELVELHDEDAVLLASLSPDEWRVVRDRGVRGELLEVARSGDGALVRSYVSALMRGV